MLQRPSAEKEVSVTETGEKMAERRQGKQLETTCLPTSSKNNRMTGDEGVEPYDIWQDL